MVAEVTLTQTEQVLFTLPFDNLDANFEERIDLEDTTYIFWVRYNTRMARWVLSIKTDDNENIVMGLPLLTGVDLLERFKDERLPQGTLTAINLNSDTDEGERDDLGEGLIVVYQTSAGDASIYV